MKNTLFRLGHMLLGWGTVGVVYSLTDRLQGAGTLLPPSALDRAIPFSPTAIWLYLSSSSSFRRAICWRRCSGSHG